MELFDCSKISFVSLVIVFVSIAGILPSNAEAKTTIEIENQYVKYVIGSDGRNLQFIDKRTGTDYCVHQPASVFARLTKDGVEYGVSAVSYTNGRMTVQFGKSGVSAVIAVERKKHYFVLEVLSVSDSQVKELVFIDLPLTCKGILEEPFAGCVLALNLQTNVKELPGPNSRLKALCYSRFGFAGARAAVIGCPQSALRNVMKEVVSAAEELPHSPLGGPWALDAAVTHKGSYFYGDPTEETVDDWIKLARNLGINQINLEGYGGNCFRHGDYRPNPKKYPQGLKSLKAVIDRLHAAGIKVGLHTLSFSIDKNCPWVTPVPDPRLGKDETFTLAESMGPEDTVVPVIKSTKDMPTTTGYLVRKSVTLQIDDELVTYSGITDRPPYAFTGCERGACGTTITSHAKGAKVYHLKECWGHFVPDGDSTLFSEVTERIAEIFNECGFDMIYLDGLDGEHVFAGAENGWHYGSKLAFEVWKRLKKPAFMEMAVFHHHLWLVRSRMGAWDTPNRSHKKFIDIHCSANEQCRRIFMPKHLGWWRLKTWSGHQGEPTFPDDIEYLCCKCLGTDAALSLNNISPGRFARDPYVRRLATIIKQYETLRRENYFGQSVKKKLRAPGEEFTLQRSSDGEWQFYPIQYAKHKVQGIDGFGNIWRVRNKFGRQPVKLRIEALMSAVPYNAPGNVILADFRNPDDFTERGVSVRTIGNGETYSFPSAAPGITAELQPSSAHVKVGPVSGRYTASNTLSRSEVKTTARYARYSLFDHGTRVFSPQPATWVRIGKEFSSPLDLSKHQGIGVWIYGDGQGEILNFQLRATKHIRATGHFWAIGEHYVIVDFTGWRYFELVEPEGERFDDYSWPYGRWLYATYAGSLPYNSVETLNLWYNNIPPGRTVTCYLSPIKALPLVKAKLTNPAVTIADRTIIFPTEIESGCYLEFDSLTDCKLYSPRGKIICEVHPQGDVPILQAGENQVRFNCSVKSGHRARANVTLISRAEIPLRR